MANSSKLNSKEFISDFLCLYESLPALWRVRSLDYNNEFKKDEAYSKMVDFVKPIYKGATEKFVKSKINSLTARFRKECQKVLESKRRGASPNEIYIPKLWYYDMLSFIFDQDFPSAESEELLAAQFNDQESTNDTEDISLNSVDSALNHSHAKKRKFTFTACTSRNDVDLNEEAKKPLEKDEIVLIDACLQNVAAKLRKMSANQRLFAEKIINDAVYLGILNRLTEFSRVNTSKD